MRLVISGIFGEIPVEKKALDTLKLWATKAEGHLAAEDCLRVVGLPTFAKPAKRATLESRDAVLGALKEADKMIAEIRMLL